MAKEVVFFFFSFLKELLVNVMSTEIDLVVELRIDWERSQRQVDCFRWLLPHAICQVMGLGCIRKRNKGINKSQFRGYGEGKAFCITVTGMLGCIFSLAPDIYCVLSIC